jgi:hypothetical protein
MILPMAELRAALAPGQRLLGLDPGARTIGIALSDVLLMLATPHAQMKRGKLTANAAEIASIATRQGAGGRMARSAPPPRPLGTGRAPSRTPPACRSPYGMSASPAPR